MHLHCSATSTQRAGEMNTVAVPFSSSVGGAVWGSVRLEGGGLGGWLGWGEGERDGAVLLAVGS